MKKLLIMALAGTGVAGSVTACGSEESTKFATCATKDHYVMAVSPDEGGGPKPGTAAMINVMEDILDKEIKTLDISDGANTGLAIASCQIDLMWGSAGTFWDAEFMNPTLDIIGAHSETNEWSGSGYNSYIVTNKATIAGEEADWFKTWDANDADAREYLDDAALIEKLRDTDFSFGGTTSTSGTLAPRQWFWDNTDKSDYTQKDHLLNDGVFFDTVQNHTGGHDGNLADILDHSAKGDLFSSIWDATVDEYDYSEVDGHNEGDVVILKEIQVAAGPLWGNMSAEDQWKLQQGMQEIDSITNPELYWVNGDVDSTDDHSSAWFEGNTEARLFAADKGMPEYQAVKNMNSAEDWTR